MSIYATLWELKFPLFGQSHKDCEWETVVAQGVPEHIGKDCDADYLSFLPPREGSIEDELRAVVFIRKLDKKGTERSAQEYLNPLLMISGKDYRSTSFAKLHERLTNALLGNRPRVVAEILEPSGTIRVLYDDGSSQNARIMLPVSAPEVQDAAPRQAPVAQKPSVAMIPALKKASKTLDKLLESKSIDVEDVIADFKVARKKAVMPKKAKAKAA